MATDTDNGLQLRLEALRTKYGADEPPELAAVLTNVSPRPLTVCTYLARHRLLSTLASESGYEVLPFRPTPRPPLGPGDFVELAPGQHLRFPLALAEAAREGYRLTWGGSLPPVVDEQVAVTGLPSGEHTMLTHFGSHVSFYDAPPGTYNHGRERLSILHQVPRRGDGVPTTAWEGDLVARCLVTYE